MLDPLKCVYAYLRVSWVTVGVCVSSAVPDPNTMLVDIGEFMPGSVGAGREWFGCGEHFGWVGQNVGRIGSGRERGWWRPPLLYPKLIPGPLHVDPWCAQAI